MNVEKEFNTVKELAEHVLEKNPSTRNSDTILYVEMCKFLGAKSIDDIPKVGLNMITVHKIRQVIQNKDGKYLPDEATKEIRKARNSSIKTYMSNNK